jgi:predicted nucleic acid-binding protein
VKPAVLNASPLIVLARAGYLDLVPKLDSGVVVPRAVATEVTAGPVVHIQAEGDQIRLISARRASASEESLYDQRTSP